ncbi:MAG: PAS domain S-box protein [Oryzomonas sp.]|uniref:PAS domain S-box protein n=1 Tax=Oryzomonas sp. TaxID=2855186 RepID=UPI0028498B3C|nr:PAS domain S-box protein [Oryzomonas sp.]MDR3579793.1 PAS domain S-box protein [Oryzomonas sp.]
MRIDLKIAIAFALGLLIIVVVGVSSFVGIQQTTESRRMVAHSYEVLEKLEHVLSQLKDAETGQRGFLLTGEERYLEPYNAAVVAIGKTTDSLVSLIKDNPAQQQSLHQFTSLARAKLNELQQTIKLRKEDGMGAALSVVKTNQGQHIMDEARTVIDQMEAREWILLDNRNRIVNKAELQHSRLLGIGMFLSVLVLSLAAIVMTRTVRLGKHDAQIGDIEKKWSGVVISYSFAVAMVALSMMLRQWVVSSFGPLPPFIMFAPAIILVAAIAGCGPGILATLLALLAADYWYFPPIGSFAIKNPNDAIALGIFGSAGMFLCLFAERVKRARLAEAVSVSRQQDMALLNMGNLLILDLNRRVVHWSEGGGRLYGYDAAEARGHLIDELLQTRSSPPMEQITGELMKQGYWEGELSRRDKSGTELFLAILLALRCDEQGKPLAILEVSTDITARMKAEVLLRESEERFKSVLDSSRDVIYRLNLQTGRYEYISQSAKQLLGFSAEELMAQNIETVLAMVHPDDLLAIHAVFACQGDNDEAELEYRQITKNGDYVWVSNHFSLIRDDAGRPLYRCGNICDIGEHKRAMEALRASEERLKIFIDHAPAALAMFDRNMCYLNVSHRWLMDYGLDNRNLLGLSHYDVYPWIHDEWKEAHRRGLAGEVLKAEADRFERPDGSVQWVRWEIRPWYESDGLVGGIMIFAEDITARIQAEEERARLLAEVENRAALSDATFSSMAIGLIVYDADGKAIQINNIVKELLPPELFFDMPIGERLQIVRWEKANGQPYSLEELPVTRALRGEMVHNEILASSFPDHKLWISVRASPIRTTNGKLLGAVTSFIDITENKRAEEILCESEERFRTLANAIPQLCWMANADGWVVWYNQRWYEYTGTTSEQMEGWGWQAVHDPEVLPHVLERWKASISSGEPFDMMFPLRGGDGKFRPFLTRMMPVCDQEGDIVGWCGTSTDITERKQAEEMLEKFNAELEKRVEERTAELRVKEEMLLIQSRQAAMGEMIGNIAHQWRQPLNSLGLTIQSQLLHYDLGEFTREFLHDCVNSSMELIQHMSCTIDDFRNYFRPDKKKVDFKPSEVVAKTLPLIEDSFKNQNIHIETIAKDEPVINGCQNEFMQVILNILSNARDVLMERKIKDPCVTITIGTENGKAIIAITDNAGGIPEEIKEKIFDPYFTTKGPQAGTGVGLFMSKTIIEKNMNGSLTAQNTDIGAQFRIEV